MRAFPLKSRSSSDWQGVNQSAHLPPVITKSQDLHYKQSTKMSFNLMNEPHHLITNIFFRK